MRYRTLNNLSINLPCGIDRRESNAENFIHYIRSLTPRHDHGEYARCPFNCVYEVFSLLNNFILDRCAIN